MLVYLLSGLTGTVVAVSWEYCMEHECDYGSSLVYIFYWICYVKALINQYSEQRSIFVALSLCWYAIKYFQILSSLFQLKDNSVEIKKIEYPAANYIILINVWRNRWVSLWPSMGKLFLSVDGMYEILFLLSSSR